MRYEKKALGWWFHDVVVHPISGTIGLVGNLTRSFRLMALAHHLHNGSAPSNDAVADYIQAASRACENETAGNPQGSSTPDEQDHAQAQAQIVSGRSGFIPYDEAVFILRGAAIEPWKQQGGVQMPTLLTKSQVEAGREERRLRYVLDEATREYDAFMDRRFNHYEIRDMGEEGKQALKAQGVKLADAVNRARHAFEQERSGVSVRDLLAPARRLPLAPSEDETTKIK